MAAAFQCPTCGENLKATSGKHLSNGDYVCYRSCKNRHRYRTLGDKIEPVGVSKPIRSNANRVLHVCPTCNAQTHKYGEHLNIQYRRCENGHIWKFTDGVFTPHTLRKTHVTKTNTDTAKLVGERVYAAVQRAEKSGTSLLFMDGAVVWRRSTGYDFNLIRNLGLHRQ